MSDSRVSDGGGVGLCGILFVVFLVLKLTGNITWAWIWVLSPLWVSFLITAIVIGIMFVVKVKNLPSNKEWKKQEKDIVARLKLEKRLKKQNRRNK